MPFVRWVLPFIDKSEVAASHLPISLNVISSDVMVKEEIIPSAKIALRTVARDHCKHVLREDQVKAQIFIN